MARGSPVVTETYLYACLEAGAWLDPFLSQLPSTSSNPDSVQNSSTSTSISTPTSSDSVFLHPRFNRRIITAIHPENGNKIRQDTVNLSKRQKGRTKPTPEVPRAYSDDGAWDVVASPPCIPWDSPLLKEQYVYLGHPYDSVTGLERADPTLDVLSALVKLCGGSLTHDKSMATVTVTGPGTCPMILVFTYQTHVTDKTHLAPPYRMGSDKQLSSGPKKRSIPSSRTVTTKVIPGHRIPVAVVCSLCNRYGND